MWALVLLCAWWDWQLLVVNKIKGRPLSVDVLWILRVVLAFQCQFLYTSGSVWCEWVFLVFLVLFFACRFCLICLNSMWTVFARNWGFLWLILIACKKVEKNINGTNFPKSLLWKSDLLLGSCYNVGLLNFFSCLWFSFGEVNLLSIAMASQIGTMRLRLELLLMYAAQDKREFISIIKPIASQQL